MNLEGKVALVTGSSKGIGKAVASSLSRCGALTIITGRNKEAVDEAAGRIKEAGGRCDGLAADVTDKTQLEELIHSVLEKHQRIDILVNSVGGSAPAVPLAEFPDDLWESQLKNNLNSVFYCTRLVVDDMKKRSWGRIVNIASVAGRSYSQLGGVAYAAAKHGVVGFTRQLARELAPFSITVNCVAPGLIATERIEKRFYARSAEQQQEILDKIPLGRPGRPEEVAWAVTFLTSDLSGYITGAVIDVNGGILMV